MLYRGDFVHSIIAFEQPEGSIAARLKYLLTGNPHCGIITGTDIRRSYHTGSFSLGIIPPLKDGMLIDCDEVNCDTLLVPGAFFPADSSIYASRVVSYGFSPRDSITFSSIGEKKTVITIQRELFTLDGCIIEQQDIPIKNADTPIDDLVISSALLLLGTAPESLSLRTGNHIKTIF
jgi:hypothetical protein